MANRKQKSRPSAPTDGPAEPKNHVVCKSLGYLDTSPNDDVDQDIHAETSTLAVHGITPYAQIPNWILRAGGQLSHAAVRLYGVIMSYADNDDHTAFPARETLAQDMGASVATVKRAIKDLEAFGALVVKRRRNKRTGNFYANHYVLVFASPWVTGDPRRGVTSDPITKPTMLTKPTTHSTSDPPESDEEHFTCKTSFDTRDDHLPKENYLKLRSLLQDVGKSITVTGSFRHDDTQDRWIDFQSSLEEHMQHLPYGDVVVDLVATGKWTVTAKVADEYQAGKELTTLLNTARNH